MSAPPKAEDLRGWLKRKGGRMKTWSRRWCVLTDKFLFIFLREDDRRSQDCITLSGQLIVEPPADPADTCRGYFDIVTEYGRGITETLSLCAETEEDKNVWMRALKRALYADKGGALFCQSLEEILYWERLAGRHIPYIVDECVEYLYKYGLDVEGIFRLPGRQSAAKDIISRFERGQKITFEEEGTDVHVVASVLKAFLRSLPDSLIPCHLFQKFMNIALRFTEAKDEISRNISVQELADALKLLSKDSYTILKYICRFLQVVGQHEPTNKMSMMSLGTVFSYNILRHIDKENNYLFLLTADLGQNLVYMLLKYYAQVFSQEHRDKEESEHEHCGKDLLRMSNPVDTPVILPSICSSLCTDQALQSTEVSRRENTGSYEVCKISDDNMWPSGKDKTVDELDEGAAGKTCLSILGSKSQHLERKSLHLNLLSIEGTSLTEHGIARSHSSSSLREVCSVSPRRLKSRIARNRYLSDRRILGPITLDADDWLPRDRHSPGGVNSEDVVIALAQAQASPQTLDSPGSHIPRVHSCHSFSLDIDRSFDNSGQVLDESPVFEPEEKAGQVSGISDLLKQVTTLREELSQQRDNHRVQIAVLKAQLSEMIEKYEHKIETVQKNYKSQIKELENKLSEEKKSCAAIIAESAELQEKMKKYQMLYGELS
ncbi:unnamed protein product [Candidula unifasciata]|uniref:Rho GTPase-activating protein 24 n=1 Tax=Candidula unifasciata TaxID=100452 RepID=A0A8S3YZV6_9EUPU|nr:unnamed protein product [Candidula unifasciata]